MAQTVGTVYVEVVPSGKGFGKRIEGDISPAIDNVGKQGSTSLISKLGGAFSKVGSIGIKATAAIGTAVVGLAAKGGFNRALDIENAQAKLKGLGHDSSSVTEIMTDALKSVKGTAFGLGDAATVAASLSAAGVKQGGQLTSVLKTVADTAQISGRSLTDIGTIFGSVAARNKLQGDDMLQLMQSGIPVLQLLGKHLGKTSAQVSDMVSSGKIDFQTFADAMQEGMGGAALKAGGTFIGAWSNVKAALSRMGVTIMQPILDGLRGMFNRAIPLIDRFTVTATPIMERVGGALRTGLEQALPALQSLGGKVMAHLQPLAEPLKNLLGSIGTAMDQLGSHASGFGQAFSSIFNGLVKIAVRVVNALSSILGQTGSFSAISMLADVLTASLQLLGDAINFVADNSNWLLPLAGAIGGAVLAAKGLGAVSAGLGSVAKTAGGIAKTATGISSWVDTAMQMGGIIPGLKQLASGMSLVKGAQTAWNAITKAGTAVQVAFQAVLSASPWGVAIAGITAVVAALTWFFTQTETGKKIWSNFTQWLGNAWQSVCDTGKQLWQGLGDFFGNLWSAINDGVQSAWGGITAFFGSLWSAHIQPALQGFWDGLTGFIGDLVMIVAAVPSQLLQWLQTGLSTLFGAVDGLLQSWYAAAPAPLQGFIGGLQTIVEAGWSVINGIIQTAIDLISTIVTVFLDVLRGNWSGAWQAIADFIGPIWDGIKTTISTAFNAVKTTISDIGQAISDWWDAKWQAISDFIGPIWDGIEQKVTGAFNTVKDFISSKLGEIKAQWDAQWQAIGNYLGNIWNGIKTTVSNGLQSVANTVGQIKSIVTSKVSDAGNWLRNAGRDIISGLIGGISGAMGWLKNTITSLGSNVVNWAKNVLKIHSPSRVMRDEVGVMIGRGMAVGIDRSAPAVQDSLRSMNTKLAQGLDPIDISGSITRSASVALPDGIGSGRGRDDASLQDVVDALLLILNSLPRILDAAQPDGISERDFARLVRQYA